MPNKREISEQDAHRVELFKEYITVNTEAETMRKGLMNIYFNYSQLLVKAAGEGKGGIYTDTETNLFYLGEIIQLLDDHDL